MLSVVRHSFTPRIAATVCFEVFALNFLFWSQPTPVFVGADPTGALAASSWVIVAVCASFNTAVDVLSKEQRWLTMARSDRKQFTALCEGWASAPVSEPIQ